MGARTSVTSVGRLERASRGRGGRRAGCPGHALQTFHAMKEEPEGVNCCAERPVRVASRSSKRSTYRTDTWGEGGAPGPLPTGPLACVFLRILTIICTHPRHPHRQRRIFGRGSHPKRAFYALLQEWILPLEVARSQRSRGHRCFTSDRAYRRKHTSRFTLLLSSTKHVTVKLHRQTGACSLTVDAHTENALSQIELTQGVIRNRTGGD